MSTARELQQICLKTAFAGLSAQGFEPARRSSLNGPICVWRTEEGYMCAVGHLISKAALNKYQHPHGYTSGTATRALRWRVFKPEIQKAIDEFETEPNGVTVLDVLEALQKTHDKSVTPLDMKERLIELAERWEVEL